MKPNHPELLKCKVPSPVIEIGSQVCFWDSLDYPHLENFTLFEKKPVIYSKRR